MAYQVLARKCRPQDFSGLIGQEPIVTALRNAITDGRIAQAYIFAGIRGVGKTSAARILAKALNCEQGPTPEPCNECRACTEITRGGSMDVLEVDAATYSKVEQVRELTESLKYGPAKGRYKVVILDEVHRLSRQAFDALLKIIEEPPAHLVFIFATTEMEAVPATILSRCQELIFRRVPVAVLARHLATLCEAENLTVSETTLRLIARAGEGSVRDSVALLDQLATFGGGGIADEDAARLLGGLDTALFEALLRAILEGDPATVTATVNRLEEEGRDPRQAFAQFLIYCREALHLSLGASAEAIDLPGDEAEKLAALARNAGYENLLRLVQSLLGSEAMVRRSEVGSLALEIAWLKTAELPKLVRVEEILKGGLGTARSAPAAPPKDPPAQSRRQPAPPPQPPQRRQPKPQPPELAQEQAPEPTPEPEVIPEPEPPPELAPQPRPQRKPEPASDSAPSASTPPSGNPKTAFLEEVSQRKVPLAAHLSRCRLEIAGREVVVHVPENEATLRKALDRRNNRAILTEAAHRALGSGATWRSVTEAAPKESTAPIASQAETRENGSTDEEATHPTQQLLTDLFDGAVETDA
jgi:DNA polymerase-3 subunit gamma/tau